MDTSLTQVAKQLSLSKSSLSKWVRLVQTGKLNETGKGQRILSELKQALAETKMERNLLKKFATYFAKEPR